MEQNAIQQIKEHLKAKPSEELQEIYATNDTDSYRPEAFAAIREILLERGRETESLLPRQRAPIPSAEPERRVVVTDIRMSFTSMVVFMVKWAVASIPAAIILFILGALLWALLGAVVSRGF